MAKIELSDEEREINEAILLNVGHSLRKLRESVGYTLEEASAITGLPVVALKIIEAGTKGIRSILLFRLVAAYGGHLVIDAPNSTIDMEEYEVEPLKPGTREASRWIKQNDYIFDKYSNQKTDTPPAKKRRPRLPRPSDE